jgi:ribulose-phosphate 3-epimerase
MTLIAPSILSADFTRLGEELRAVEAAGADWIHADIMDGHFVPNISYGPMIVAAVRRATKLPIDVHLMISEPDRYVPEFVQAGADWISVHAESGPHLNRSLQLIRGAGVKAGVVLNPATPVAAVEWVLDAADYVLVMSVNPGFGGQTFIPNSIARIEALRRMIAAHGSSALIEVDGGVGPQNAREILAAGADVLVAGSAVFGSGDYRAAIRALRGGAPRGKEPA